MIPDFPARVQFIFPQALAANEGLVTVPDNSPCVQAQALQFSRCQSDASLTHSSDDLNLYARFGAALQQADHLHVGKLVVIDQQLLARPIEEIRKLFAGIDGTHNEGVQPRCVRRSGSISLKQLNGLLHELAVFK